MAYYTIFVVGVLYTGLCNCGLLRFISSLPYAVNFSRSMKAQTTGIGTSVEVVDVGLS